MKALLANTLLVLSLAPALSAQAPAPQPIVTANPVVWSAHEIFVRQSKYMIAAAEEMPADKLTFRPTPEQWTYARIISHVAAGNGAVCAMLSDMPSPKAVNVAETASKEDLLAALKLSFDFCAKSLDTLKDAQLGDTITYFGRARVPRARALIELTDDLEDHYSQMASYLRLNGMLPPSATPPKK